MWPMRPIAHPSAQTVMLAQIFHALSDPAHLRILERIALAPELACNATGEALPRSTLSHHFRILREAGLLTCRREGTLQLNRLRREIVDAKAPGLLDTVLAAAEREERPGPA